MGIFQYFWDFALPFFGVSVATSTSAPSITLGIQNYSAEHIRNLMMALNDVRSNVQPPAKRMDYLKWDDDLVEDAKKLVANCNRDFSSGHSTAIAVTHSEYNNGFTVRNMVDTWMVASYDPITDLCLSTMTLCNNYKLLIRHDNSKVGCATNVCPDNPQPLYVTACKFNKELTSGVSYQKAEHSCTGCSEDEKCVKNLCTKLTDIEEETTTTTVPITTTPLSNSTSEPINVTQLPTLTHGKPHWANLTGPANMTNGTTGEEKWYTIVHGNGVSLTAFIIACVLLAITLVVAIWALVIGLRLKSQIPVDNKNF